MGMSLPEGYSPRMRVWKLIGLGGLLGAIATGAAVARDERVRRHYSAGEIRERLHARLDEAVARGVRGRLAAPAAHGPLPAGVVQ